MVLAKPGHLELFQTGRALLDLPELAEKSLAGAAVVQMFAGKLHDEAQATRLLDEKLHERPHAHEEIVFPVRNDLGDLVTTDFLRIARGKDTG